ncbi:hypothetical protein PanWU01x14_081210 [Parasponia andersonii]|uniref:Uncharacterized protein n=1 Tax=Parasponia andersonii TaxID=3476 RepID=A0A2P5DAZ5_PARAD|nr:hypothetical protein PanWU01x14_081210 [Parasponia andersonii]
MSLEWSDPGRSMDPKDISSGADGEGQVPPDQSENSQRVVGGIQLNSKPVPVHDLVESEDASRTVMNSQLYKRVKELEVTLNHVREEKPFTQTDMKKKNGKKL